MKNLFLIACFALLCIDEADGCSYFRRGFQKKVKKYSIPAADSQCVSLFESLAGNVTYDEFKPSITGHKLCTYNGEKGLFIAVYECATRCANECGAANKVLTSVNCHEPTFEKRGRYPHQIQWSCDCAYADESVCEISPVQWTDVESSYESACIGGGDSEAGATEGGNNESETETSTGGITETETETATGGITETETETATGGITETETETSTSDDTAETSASTTPESDSELSTSTEVAETTSETIETTEETTIAAATDCTLVVKRENSEGTFGSETIIVPDGNYAYASVFCNDHQLFLVDEVCISPDEGLKCEAGHVMRENSTTSVTDVQCEYGGNNECETETSTGGITEIETETSTSDDTAETSASTTPESDSELSTSTEVAETTTKDVDLSMM